MRKFIIPILGTTYTCKVGTREEVCLEEDTQGTCNFYSKQILISTDVDVSFNEEEKRVYLEETIFHEISHAILYESGLISEAHEEKLPEWLSVNSVKLVDYAENFIRLALDIKEKK